MVSRQAARLCPPSSGTGRQQTAGRAAQQRGWTADRRGLGETASHEENDAEPQTTPLDLREHSNRRPCRPAWRGPGKPGEGPYLLLCHPIPGSSPGGRVSLTTRGASPLRLCRPPRRSSPSQARSSASGPAGKLSSGAASTPYSGIREKSGPAVAPAGLAALGETARGLFTEWAQQGPQAPATTTAGRRLRRHAERPSRQLRSLPAPRPCGA